MTRRGSNAQRQPGAVRILGCLGGAGVRRDVHAWAAFTRSRAGPGERAGRGARWCPVRGGRSTRGPSAVVTSVLPVALRRSPVAGSTAYPGLISLAGAVGSATGLSLRSPRPFKIFFWPRAAWCRLSLAQFFLCPLENILRQPGSAGCPPALSACVPSGAGTHPNQTPPPGTPPAKEQTMDVTTSPSATITCAKPGCGAVTTLAASGYIDGCGQVCPGCSVPLRSG